MKLFETQTRALLCLALLVGILTANTACSAQDRTIQEPKALDKAASVDTAAEFDMKQKFDIMLQEPISGDARCQRNPFVLG